MAKQVDYIRIGDEQYDVVSPTLKEEIKKRLVQPLTAQIGQIFKVQAINEDGTLVLEAVDMPSGDVTDVQINGTSIVGEGGVAKIPLSQKESLSGDTNYCLFRTNQNYGITNAKDGSGYLQTFRAPNDYIDSRVNYYNPIVPANLDYAVKCAMCDGKGAEWTDSEKTGAWKRLNSIKNVMDEIAVAGANYFLGEVTELNITLPTDAEIGQEITVAWYNGETPSTLAIYGTILEFDYTPSANSRSEISCLFDGRYWCCIGNEQSVPVEEVVADE